MTANGKDRLAIELLSNKLRPWRYEKEVRVFVRGKEDFVDVEIKEIIMGRRISRENRKLIKGLANEFLEDVKFREGKAYMKDAYLRWWFGHEREQ